MPEFGFAVEFAVDYQGSELDAPALSTDTVLVVEDATEYDTPGIVSVNDVQVATLATDLDAGTITLAAPLGADAEAGDRVLIVAGGEIAYDHTLTVQSSDGEAHEIPVAFAERALWGEPGPIDPPIPVTLADDLSAILDVPGRRSMLSPLAFQPPLFVAHLDVDQAIPSGSTYTTVLNWQVTTLSGGMDYDGILMDVVVPLDGWYAVSGALMWGFEPSMVGRRAVKPSYGATGFGVIPGGVFVADAMGTRQTTPVVTPLKPMSAGGRVQLMASQTSGVDINLIGGTDGVESFFCVEYRGPLT